MIAPVKVDDKTITASNDQTYFTLKTNDGFEPLALKVGTTYGPVTLEPVDSWDTASSTVLNQVVETLFTYYLSDPNLPRVPYLAEGYWWEEDSPILHITLRQGIRFHDGTLLDAAAAKWNFDRLLYLTDCTRTNTGQVAHTQSLWMFPDGVTPIIASVSTVGDWEVVLTLNGPYAPLLDLLCYTNAGMLSPSSTPATEFIDLYGGQVIGTGPFKYEYFNPGVEVRLSRWDYYWRGPAYFEAVSFLIYPTLWEMHEVFLAHQLDYLLAPTFDNLPTYEADPLITVDRFTEDTGIPGLVYRFLGFNNEKYDVDWRKAMSYAIDYTYIIEEIRGGNGIRANSPISPGFGAAYNPYATAATFNIDTARSIMQSMGFGIGFTTDDDWVTVAEGDSPFLTVPYTYNIGNTYREDLGAALTDWLKLIGIKVIDDGVSSEVFTSYLYEDHDHLGIFELGWGPDFFEPFNMIYPLFSSGTFTNTAQVDDPWLNAQLALALETVDDTARNDIYKDIQWYMAEEGYFHAYLWHPEVTFVHLTEIQGVPYNALEIFYAYPMYREMQQEFYLASDAGEPDDDGAFTLYWTESAGAYSYSVYIYWDFITEITEDLYLIAEDYPYTSLPLEGFSDGTYFFIVVAHSDSGDILSNCIQIDVFINLPPMLLYDTIPDVVEMTYTRTSQIIGSFLAYASTPIIYAGWGSSVDPGFSLITTYTQNPNGGMYISETTLMTTNKLEPGVHQLHLSIYESDGDFYDKMVTVIVYRQAKLSLRGEFDYLLRENIKIVITAQVIDVEDQISLSPEDLGMTVYLRILDNDGNVKAEDTMVYDANGFFYWDSVDTIKELWRTYRKGIYIVQAWVEFSPESYYIGGSDIIEFHIDPPGSDESIFWLFGFGGIAVLGIALAFLYLHKHRRCV